MSQDPEFSFAIALLRWFDQHGRKHLPWQHPIEPYRVWLSEIMLQQTQVETVIPYFERFTTRFPNMQALAEATQDDVLHLWTGLGYYARARNLHKCAQAITEEYGGIFPSEPEALVSLPGIGPSTANAIASIAFGKASAILDGNVKRVLTRFHAVSGWPGTGKVEKQLWHMAQSHMPKERCGDYTQAIMDLGATLCTRSKPQCQACPMQHHCQAYLTNSVARYPEKKPTKASPTKATVMLILQDQNGALLIEQRPAQGIWGGLWSFLEFDSRELAHAHASTYGKITHSETWGLVKHVFSHYKLNITPEIVQVQRNIQIKDNDTQRWLSPENTLSLGLAAPVKRLIENLAQQSEKLI